MKNMCLENLVLVDPIQYPHAQATARASGADDVLHKARVFDSLDQALTDFDLVIGASARMRKLSWPQLNPRQFTEKVFSEPKGTRIAVLFGREHSGLTNEELERCHYLLYIPSNPDYSSLNIAAAAQVIAYEIHRHWVELNETDQSVNDASQSIDGEPYAEAEDMERFYQHLNDTLIDIEFLQTQHPRKLMRRLRRLFNRARPDRVELNILRGILTTMQRVVRRESNADRSPSSENSTDKTKVLK